MTDGKILFLGCGHMGGALLKGWVNFGGLDKTEFIIVEPSETIRKTLKKEGYKIYGTDVRDGVDVKEIAKDKKRALILGNETRGVSTDIAKLADMNLYIKLDEMESLNVSVAGSILMYEM